MINIYVFQLFFFSSRRRHTRFLPVSWARRCVQETGHKIVIFEKGHDEQLEEPLTHTQNISLIEKCCCMYSRDELTYTELKSYQPIRNKSNILFDFESNDHNNKVRELWLLLEGSQLQEDLKSERWKDYGFQNADPRTDFRGGGLLSLDQIFAFCRNNLNMVKEIIEERHQFLFAITSINITFFLMKYFHMPNFLEFHKDKDQFCSRKALKNFCRCLQKNQDSFDILHEILLKDIFATWIEIKKQNPSVTIMEFDTKAIQSVKKKFNTIMNQRQYDKIEQITMFYSYSSIQTASNKK
eukprot:TRINITY_DN21269_c0_g1_i1.p1 TRINITY_DN21269_c0_g1~~TRINITY_DN21269_c0_g1_i1.p1  ORF type:complete len:297 (+),score=37.64 TRINITY_DN21269_c0_g1_i1:2-892(+)